jgi:hypothetical protein
MLVYYTVFFFLNAFGVLEIVLSGIGGGGSTDNLPRSQATLSEGCAPQETQYCILSVLTVNSLKLSFVGIGLYVPTLH